MIYLYIYLFIGFIVSITQFDDMYDWAKEKYPTLKREYVKALPNTLQGKLSKMMIVGVYGVIAILTIIACEILWIPLAIEYLISGRKRK
ncbi:MAG: hypothetical protein RBR02_10140 [Desulfuromonadaceae bacterium]|nr:hypothetical protein [Desulfuromonadaceae bacterium]